jgi:hypothetical protein
VQAWNPISLSIVIGLAQLYESHSYDQKKGGYMEPWKILSDWARQSYEKEGRVDHASIMMKNFL